MSFKVIPTKFFLGQLAKLDAKSKSIVGSKIELLRVNPYRFKRIHSKKFSKVFRIRLSLSGKDMRFIYVVLDPNVILVCFLERSKDYKDLEGYLKMLS